LRPAVINKIQLWPFSKKSLATPVHNRQRKTENERVREKKRKERRQSKRGRYV